MAKIRLTDGPAGSVWKKAPPGKTLEYYDTICPGLTLRVGARGGSYLVVFRMKGVRNQVRRKIGTPNTLTLEEARTATRAMIRDAQKGITPDDRRAAEETERQAKREAERRAEQRKFKVIADAYLACEEKGGAAHLASNAELERKLKVDLKTWHDRPIRSILRAEIKELIKTKAGRKLGPETYENGPASNRLLSFIKRVFRWALEQDDPAIDADPSYGVRPLHSEKPRERLLLAEEIWWFWRGCEAIGFPAGHLFQLCLVTGQRRGEVAGIRQSELGELEYETTDEEGAASIAKVPAWHLPAERTKRRVAHPLPLSKLALELIEDAKKAVNVVVDGEEFEDEDPPDHLLASGRRGDQPVSGWSRYKAALDEAIGEARAKAAGEDYAPEKHDLPPWHVHDLRRTAASHMRRLRVPKPVISFILNHAEGGRSMTSVYLEGPHAEAVDALERWGEHLRKMVARKPDTAGEDRRAA